MEKKSALIFFIPLVAVVVIIESVLLLNKLNKNEGVQELPKSSNLPVTLTWVAEAESTMGASREIVVKMSAPEKVAVDAVDLYIKYDPSLVTVSGADDSLSFVKPSFSKVSQEKGLVVINYLVSAPNGFELGGGKEAVIAKLKVNYISTGNVGFDIAPGTLVVENGSAKVLPFNSESLVVNVVSN